MPKRDKRKQLVDTSGGQSTGSGLPSALAEALKAEGFLSPTTASTASASTDDLRQTKDSARRPLAELLRAGSTSQVRKERKGRKGKTVTVIGGFSSLSDAERSHLARELGRALGCGAFAADEEIVAQGDQVARVREWLLSKQ